MLLKIWFNVWYVPNYLCVYPTFIGLDVILDNMLPFDDIEDSSLMPSVDYFEGTPEYFVSNLHSTILSKKGLPCKYFFIISYKIVILVCLVRVGFGVL